MGSPLVGDHNAGNVKSTALASNSKKEPCIEP
jgi:hypothetical protein